MAAKTKYTADIMKAVEFFGMAPTARAKFGTLRRLTKDRRNRPIIKSIKKK